MTKTAITVILVMTLVITYFAQVQPTAALKTAYIQAYAEPSPVGIGQTMVIGGWITPLPSYSLPNFVFWTNLTFQITKPNGAVVNLGPYTADSAANLAETYVPDQIGNYTFKISWDGASTSHVPILHLCAYFGNYDIYCARRSHTFLSRPSPGPFRTITGNAP